MLFADSRPACIYWGPDRIALYNANFAVLITEAHPGAMGHGFNENFPSLVESIDPVFKQATHTGCGQNLGDILLFPTRSGYLEETYWNGQFIPLRGDSGNFEGYYNTTIEVTSQVLHKRRRAIVDQIAAIPPCTIIETFSLITEALRGNPNCIAMSMLYSYDDVDERDPGHVRLRGSIGIPDTHPFAVQSARLETSHDGLIPLFRMVKSSGRMLVVDCEDQDALIPRSLLRDIQWCGYGEQAREIVIMPLSSAEAFLGFYVQGLNPHRRYDDDYGKSIIDMARQIEAKWNVASSFERSMQRERALERRAIDSENRLQHMAQCAPLGMVQITPDFRVQWANDQYEVITGHNNLSNPDIDGFLELVADEDRLRVVGALRSIFKGEPRSVLEVRLKRMWAPPIDLDDSEEHVPAWILASSFPLVENGKVKLIMGYYTDISHQKWAENVQKRNAAAAILDKRRQEEFIDITSHEMRNPLTAITQLADGISRCDDANRTGSLETYRSVVRDNIDAANTILILTAHQKRVIDDVLILSRLESHMLSITPVPESASRVVANTVKMFDGEAAMNNIRIEIVRDQSSDYPMVDLVLIDASRLMQVLINLISNSIKFTSARSYRKITVSYGTQTVRPVHIVTEFGEIMWCPPKAEDTRHATLPPLEPGQKSLFLYFSIQDTGPGMTGEQMQRLFKRFSQATSKIHITHGGSGLGLYICRELAEKQNGGIGVASQHGVGSAFGFYIETRAVSPLDIDRPISPSQAEKRIFERAFHRRESRAEISTLQTFPNPNIPKLTRAATAIPLTVLSRPQYNVLLVEDNLFNQKILAKQLRTALCSVQVANHGLEALQILERSGHWFRGGVQEMGDGAEDMSARTSTGRTGAFDVVLLDVQMPVMDGLECCRIIRERERQESEDDLADGNFQLHRPPLPIIATTANVRQEQRDMALAAGMDGVLMKPFTASDVLERIQELFARRAETGNASGVA
jgi:signal transduction histidine kinase/DNA-binding response OmpR family regulator